MTTSWFELASQTLIELSAARGGEGATVSAVRYTLDPARMPAQDQLLSPRFVPHSHDVIIACHGERLYVGAIRYGSNRVRMVEQGPRRLTRRDVPESDRVVLASCRESEAIRAEDGARHRRRVSA